VLGLSQKTQPKSKVSHCLFVITLPKVTSTCFFFILYFQTRWQFSSTISDLPKLTQISWTCVAVYVSGQISV